MRICDCAPMAQELCVIVSAEDRVRLGLIIDDRNRPLRDCREFRARLSGSTDQAMAAVKRSLKRTANWDLAMDHSRGGMIHCFSDRFKTRKRSFVAASSLGK